MACITRVDDFITSITMSDDMNNRSIMCYRIQTKNRIFRNRSIKFIEELLCLI
ncbi:Uncharacterised protein [Vibrio cholerae]|nr:Uncharacterised protein [Vibrio cholerae]CSD12132.1 Uncharacterised protein [Vibrio cholerae]